MKQHINILLLILILINIKCFGQTEKGGISFIDPYPLQITYNKTTNLVFPYAVKSVDRGSSDILVQKVRYADTILQLKAGREGFKETNLSVVTTDGKLYSFLLQYAPSPAHLNYLFNSSDKLFDNPLLDVNGADNESDFLRNSEYIAKNKRFIRGVRNTEYKIGLQLGGIYVSNDNLYFQLQITNTSNLPLHVESLRFFIRDKKAYRRTSTQEIEMKPVYTYGNINCIYSQSPQECMVVLPAFTIDHSKYLIVEMSEKMGGHTVGLKIKVRHILKARTIRGKIDQ